MKPNATTELENPLCECANCGLRNKANDLDPTHDIWSRLQPGDTMPHGDCPECGAFCYPVTEPEKRPTIHEAMRSLLACAELNQDSLEPETIKVIQAAEDAADEPFSVRLYNRAQLAPINRPEIRLFIAAPDLLAALSALLTQAEIDATRFPKSEQSRRNFALSIARAAILKATQP